MPCYIIFYNILFYFYIYITCICLNFQVKVFGMPDMAIEDFALYGQLIGVPTLKASLVIFPIPTDDDSEVIIQNLMKVIQEHK